MDGGPVPSVDMQEANEFGIQLVMNIFILFL